MTASSRLDQIRLCLVFEDSSLAESDCYFHSIIMVKNTLVRWWNGFRPTVIALMETLVSGLSPPTSHPKVFAKEVSYPSILLYAQPISFPSMDLISYLQTSTPEISMY